MPPPVPATLAPKAAKWPQQTVNGQPPPELVHSLLGSREGGWQQFLRGPGAESISALQQAQRLAGNAAVVEMLQPGAAPTAPPAPGELKAGAELKPSIEAGAEEAKAGEAEPKQPPGEEGKATAAPMEAGKPPDKAISSDVTAAGEPAGAPLPAGKAGGAPPAGGAGAAPAPTAATPQGLQQQAHTAAQSLPPAPKPAQGSVAAPPKRRRPAPVPGPPPVPVVKPSYGDVTDPIPAATKRIETAANQTLPEQTLPPGEARKGGHLPDFTVRPLSGKERHLIQVGEEALKDAQLEPDELAKLKGLRDRALAPPAPTPENVPAPAPPQIKLSPVPLPPAQMQVAEQELFTGVLARLSTDTDKQAREILDTIKAQMRDYPESALFNEEYPVLRTLGEASQLPGITERLKAKVAGAAEAVGVAGKILDDAVAARREEVKTNPERVVVALQAQADALTKLSVEDTAARLAEAQKAKAGAADAKEKAKAAAAHKPKPGFRQIAEAAVERIKDKVSEAIARFRFQEKERLTALDGALALQIGAYEDAVTLDRIAAAKANAPSGNPPTSAALLAESKANSAEINDGKAWVKDKAATLKPVVEGFKAEVRRLTKDWITAVEDEGAAAYRDLRTWGDKKEGATEGWWQDSARKLETWASAAHDTANAWSNIEGRLARLEMQRDLQRVRASIDAQLEQDTERGAEYQAMTGNRKLQFVNTVIADQQNAILNRLAVNLITPLLEAERKPSEQVVQKEILALPNKDWPAVNYLAKLGNSKFDARASAVAIYNAGEGKWARTDEAAIFKQLSGLRAIELEAIRKSYEDKYGPGSLYGHLDKELSGDEWRRAKNLLSGKEGEAAAEAIHEAVWGPGVATEKIIDTLRGLSQEQRDAANRYYEQQYGETLYDRLGGDLDGSKLDEARALLAGRTTEAYAFELDQALRIRMGGGDREAAAAVFERIRGDVMAEAKKHDWTDAEYQAEIEARNTALEQTFDEKFAKVGKYRLFSKKKAFQGAIGYAFLGDPTQAKLVRALANNDLPRADAALMQHEREGVYADDDVLNGVIELQKSRALAKVELDRGPAKRMGIEKQLAREEKAAATPRPDAPPPKRWNERDRMDRKMALERQMNAELSDLAFEEARKNTAVLDAVLKSSHKISLDQMIHQNMSGRDRDQAKDRVRLMRQEVGDDPAAKRARRLDWTYNQIRYAIEGVGTKMSDLEAGLSGLTKEEIEEIDKRWRRDHDGETLRQAVKGDTSGREQGDLLDTVDNGAPTTVAQRMEQAERKLKRDEAATGFLGRWTSGDETSEARRALAEMKKLNADLDNPNLSPRRRAHLRQMVDQRIDSANQMIEIRRTAVDALADALTTVFQYVVGALAIVAGAIATAVTGGGALPILIAIVGSVVGTLGSMAIKQMVKGSDYGTEEMLTDLAVGAVDAIVTAVTAGAFKGGAFLKGLGGQLKVWSAASIKLSVGQALKRGAQQTVQQSIEQQAKRAGTTALGRAATGVGRFGLTFAKQQAEQVPQVLATTLTAQVLNERNLRNGNPLRNIARGTLEGSIEAMKTGAAMGLAGHVVSTGITRAAVVSHPQGSVEVRMRDYQRWQQENPRGSREQFVAEMEATQARQAQDEAQARAATREARKALLSDLPASERGAIADVPIVHLNEAAFKALSAGRGGDAFVHVHEGQVAVVVREGALPSAFKGLAGELRNIVAPGTAGRTVNPSDALPPNLRNRIVVEPTSRLGPRGVQASPLIDAAGNIIGVQLEVGPLARASDIRNHVRTVESMRKFVGLLGEVRLKMLDIGQAVGLDLVSPRQQGRWEAALEIAKLPAVIEDHVRRLAEPGLDPRRRAELESRIGRLKAQFEAETARFAKGAEAEARGYVAADPDAPGGKKKGPGRKTPPMPEETPGVKATPEAEPGTGTALPRIEQVLVELRELHAARLGASKAWYEDVLTSKTTEPIKDKQLKYIEALKELAREHPLPPELVRSVNGLTIHSSPIELAAVRRQLLQSEAFATALALTKPGKVQTIESVGKHLDTVLGWGDRRAGYQKIMADADARIAKLTEEFRSLGNVVQGIALHPDLPPPSAGIHHVEKEVTGLAANGQEKTQAQKEAHINGFKAELRLGNAIVENNAGTVIQFANKAGRHGADAISVLEADMVLSDGTVLPAGTVLLWDSKYRQGVGSFESDTFKKSSARKDAAAAALDFIRNGNHNLPPDIRAKAIQNLEVQETFLTVTSHTDGGPFRNVAKRYTKDAGVDVQPPW